MGALQWLHLLTVAWSGAQQRFVWSNTCPHDHDKHFATNCYVSAPYGNFKALDCEEYLVTNLLKWSGLCESRHHGGRWWT